MFLSALQHNMTGTQKKAEKEQTKCKNCGNSFTLFMSHLKKKIDCQRTYGKEYEQMKEVNALKRKGQK